jgi:hypothetical protein
MRAARPGSPSRCTTCWGTWCPGGSRHGRCCTNDWALLVQRCAEITDTHGALEAVPRPRSVRPPSPPPLPPMSPPTSAHPLRDLLDCTKPGRLMAGSHPTSSCATDPAANRFKTPSPRSARCLGIGMRCEPRWPLHQCKSAGCLGPDCQRPVRAGGDRTARLSSRGGPCHEHPTTVSPIPFHAWPPSAATCGGAANSDARWGGRGCMSTSSGSTSKRPGHSRRPVGLRDTHLIWNPR